MPSDANVKLKKRLLEIDEVISARDAICPAGAGKPALQKGGAVIKAGTTLLAAVFEAFVEELYENSLDLLHPTLPTEVKELKKHTSQKNNNANNHQVNNLFFSRASHGSCCPRRSAGRSSQTRRFETRLTTYPLQETKLRMEVAIQLQKINYCFGVTSSLALLIGWM